MITECAVVLKPILSFSLLIKPVKKVNGKLFNIKSTAFINDSGAFWAALWIMWHGQPSGLQA
jgi:hypothetical protein